MGTPFPGLPFLQSGVSRPQRVLFPWEHTFPVRKDSLIHGNATNESEFGEDNARLEIQGDGCKIERGPQMFTGAPGFLPFQLP